MKIGRRTFSWERALLLQFLKVNVLENDFHRGALMELERDDAGVRGLGEIVVDGGFTAG